MRVGLIQLSVGDNPADNLTTTLSLVKQAADRGATLICTPEVTNGVSSSRALQEAVLAREVDDITLAGLRDTARTLGVWIAVGSLALKTGDADGRFANRSIVISDQGEIVDRYDKIHMFDVQVSETEQFRESAGYRPGSRAVVAKTPLATLGLTVCYDLRFAQLYRVLAQAGAEVLLVPSAFLPTTGAAHWEPLLRARAIETGCFVVAAAQTGTHAMTDQGNAGQPRQTYGHSMVISPWGKVLADAGAAVGVTVVDLDLAEVAQARSRLPSLSHDRPFTGP
ncbi:carbon-nitrogen hydrolase family protein [Yoonia sp. R2331]|uniref:carbon-nitrogen hydrolase family protein n=1 Tax=Yoonia sp. R2331 TaxID=3237238 RepID=UPI0034E41D1D